MKRNNRLKKAIIITLTVLLLLVAAFYIYTLDYYRASDYANAVFERHGRPITKHITAFYPPTDADEEIGLIFYPGGKVEATAYAPLMMQLADAGITAVLVKMPFNLAVFNITAADDVLDAMPQIDTWYLSGHSLGGAMSSAYMEDHATKFYGHILMGAYPINDADIPLLAIYGSEDDGLDLETRVTDEERFRIDGGNHAYYGNYGEQKGDGVASISRQAQQAITVQQILAFISKHAD